MPQFEAITLSHLVGRSERYGRIRVWGSIGFVLVVALFGVLLDRLGETTLPWLMLPLFVGLCVSSWFNSYGGGQSDMGAGSHGGFAARLKRAEVVAFFAVAFLMQICFGPYYTFYSIYLDEHGYSTSSLGVYWSIGVILEILVFAGSGWILRRWHAAWVLLVSVAAAAVRWAMVALFADSAVLMALAQATHALSFAAFFAASMQFLALFFPGRQNGHAQGIFYGFSSGVGGVLGALLSGWVWEKSGGEMAFLFASGVALVACVVVWVWMRPTRLRVMGPGVA